MIEKVKRNRLRRSQCAAMTIRHIVAQVHGVGKAGRRREGERTVVIVDDRAVVGGQACHRQRVTIGVAVPCQQLRRRHDINVVLRTVAKDRMRTRRNRCRIEIRCNRHV